MVRSARIGARMAVVGMLAVCVNEAAPAGTEASLPIRTGGGYQIISVKPSPKAESDKSGESLTLQSPPHPVPPLAGFSPLVFVTTSNKRSSEDLDYAHQLEYSYVGNPLNPPANQYFAIGYLDSGAVINLVASPWDAVLGLTGQYMTGNMFPIGGTGGTVDAELSHPVGFFAAGWGAVDNNGLLDLNQVVGHSNVSLVVSPEISCGEGIGVTALVGTPLLSFFTSVIRVDTPRVIDVGGDLYQSPDVQLLTFGDPSIPTYPRSIGMDLVSLSAVTTASYYPDFDTLTTPILPTMLSLSALSFPFGGAFYADLSLREGPPGDTNPLKDTYMMVDTGSQSSIISPGVAADMSLPSQPDFTVDVCGIGGVTPDVPGYYIDYVRIGALGGALEFSNAPFVVIDLQGPDGQPLDGIIGMNLFWNRNIVFAPNISGSSFLHVSDPVRLIFGDMNYDGIVDDFDYQVFVDCSTGPAIGPVSPECQPLDAEPDGDIDQDDFAEFQKCFGSPPVPCGP